MSPESAVGVEKPEELALHREALGEFISSLEKYHRPEQPITIFLLGSLGRRIAMAEASSWSDYENLASLESKLKPRINVRGSYDIDIAVPTSSIPWPTLAAAARKIGKNNPGIEIDPHYIDTDSKTSLILSKNLKMISETSQNLELETFDIRLEGNLSPVKTFDRWSHLLYLLSSRNVRARDLAEIKRLGESMSETGDFNDKTKVTLAIEIIKNNKGITSPKNLLRWSYQTLVPYSLRWSLAEFRKKTALSQLNSESKDPVYF